MIYFHLFGGMKEWIDSKIHLRPVLDIFRLNWRGEIKSSRTEKSSRCARNCNVRNAA